MTLPGDRLQRRLQQVHAVLRRIVDSEAQRAFHKVHRVILSRQHDQITSRHNHHRHFAIIEITQPARRRAWTLRPARRFSAGAEGKFFASPSATFVRLYFPATEPKLRPEETLGTSSSTDARSARSRAEEPPLRTSAKRRQQLHSNSLSVFAKPLRVTTATKAKARRGCILLACLLARQTRRLSRGRRIEVCRVVRRRVTLIVFLPHNNSSSSSSHSLAKTRKGEGGGGGFCSRLNENSASR